MLGETVFIAHSLRELAGQAQHGPTPLAAAGALASELSHFPPTLY